jgi:hypothetical protein
MTYTDNHPKYPKLLLLWLANREALFVLVVVVVVVVVVAALLALKSSD